MKRGQKKRKGGGLKVVDDPADGLDVGGLGLPLIVAAVVSSLHDVHTATEVRLLIHDPASHKTIYVIISRNCSVK